MRRLLALLTCCILLACSPVDAYMNPYIAGSNYGVGCDYNVCSAGCKIVDWDCSTVTITSNTCSLGADSTATKVGEADITDGKVSLTDGSANGSDYYTFTMTSKDMIPTGDLTLRLTVNFSTITSGAYIYSARPGASDFFRVYFAAGGDITVRHSSTGSGSTIDMLKTFDVNLTTSTEYTLVIKAGAAGMSLKVNSDDPIIDATKVIGDFGAGDGSQTWNVGNTAGTKSLIGTIDNVSISAGWRTDI